MNFAPIHITPKALVEIKHILKNKNIPSDYSLRVGVKGAGCGVGFILGFDKKKDADLEYLMDEVKVLLDKKHLMYLIGMSVDFHESEDARGFTFIKDPQPTDTKQG
jgi:iron-sulfur cluster assembly protein